jgi:predicted TIM-barrel fold metal-dependent hydrolase
MSSQKWGDMIPEVRADEDGGHAWFIGDQCIGSFGASAMVKTPNDDYPTRWTEDFPHMPSRDELHTSSWDAAERVKIMDRHGISMAALFGNLGVSRNYFKNIDDEAFKVDIVRTYNDWLIDWIGVAPQRFIPLANLPFWNPAAAAQEAARAASIGHKGVVISGSPEKHDLKPFADRSWDVLWEACTQYRLPIHFHAGGGDISAHFNQVRQDVMGGGAMQTAGTTNITLDTAHSVSDLLASGVLPRFPDTKWVIVESAVGYLPFVLEAMDYHFNLYMRDNPQYAMFDALPSAYFHRQMLGTYWFEKLDQQLVDRVGPTSIMFETDYPHPTCLLENDIRGAANDGLAGIDPEHRQRILWKNAAELYSVTDVPEAASLAA